MLAAHGVTPAADPGEPRLLRRDLSVTRALQPLAMPLHRRSGPPAGCSRPGFGNFIADCGSQGGPVVEPSMAGNGKMLVVGAYDYNSYNGQGQAGFYWSTDGRRWNDDGPLDLFPHDDDNAVADARVAIDAHGVVYYAAIFFNFRRCEVGGLQLMRRNPRTGVWKRQQLASNLAYRFHDRPSLTIAGDRLLASWTEFDSCEDEEEKGHARLNVAVIPLGSSIAVPERVLTVPGADYAQGSSIASDGADGFWLAWQDFRGDRGGASSIKLARWTPDTGFTGSATISPQGFRELPSTLPGFKFRVNSSPSLAVVDGTPYVAWASADTGVGRVSLWSPRGLETVSNAGGDQFMPTVAPLARGVAVAFDAADPARTGFQHYLAAGGRVVRLSTAPSRPNRDRVLDGAFVGDYSGLVAVRGNIHAVWTDLRAHGAKRLGAPIHAMTAVVGPRLTLTG